MTHRHCPVVLVHLEPHPNADTLSIVRVAGYQVVVRTADWVDGQCAAFVPPESLVDTTRPEFLWLSKSDNKSHRVGVKKLRGEVSMGLLVPAPAGLAVGDDAAESLGVVAWNPPEPKGAAQGGEAESAPPFLRGMPVYDLESLRRYPDILQPGELVQVTEKLHGANSRFCFYDGIMWCGSHREWKRPDSTKLWWATLVQYQQIGGLCRAYPDHILFGEIYGCVQSLRYGHRRGATSFAAFDIQRPDLSWLPAQEFCDLVDHFRVPRVPVLAASIAYKFQDVADHAEGPTNAFLGEDEPHCREGCVVRPLVERTVMEIGRVVLKLHGLGYLALK